MNAIIIVCPNCSQQNRVIVDAIQRAICGTCKSSLSEKKESPAKTISGTVKRFNDAKGFGFIQDREGTDYFFHISNVKDAAEIKCGMNAEFIAIAGKKGPEAIQIVLTKNQNDHEAKFILIGDKRIMLRKIKTYRFEQLEFKYRNHIERPGNILERITFNPSDSFFSSFTFTYLHIQMFDGAVYSIYSDKHAYECHMNTLKHFVNKDMLNHLYDQVSWQTLYGKEQEALDDNLFIRRKFDYSVEDINELANKLDRILIAI